MSKLLNFNLCSLNLHMEFHLLFIYLLYLLLQFVFMLPEMLDLDEKVGHNKNMLLNKIEALNFVILCFVFFLIYVSLQHSLILYPLLHVRVLGCTRRG